MTKDPVSVSLYRSGLLISSSLHTRFLNFKDLKITTESFQLDDPPLGSLNDIIGIIGLIEIGPGYLVLISKTQNVFNFHNINIWRVDNCLILPLKFDLISKYFDLDDSTTSATNLVADAQNKDKEPSNLNNLKSFSKQVSETTDVLFSKIGIFADDLKSSASLSISKNPVLHKNYDEFDDYSVKGSDNWDELDNFRNDDSIRMKRAITLKNPTIPTNNNNPSPKASYQDISREMLKKFEKQLKTFFNTGDLYYSDELNLSKTIEFEDGKIINKVTETDDDIKNSFWFNQFISKKLLNTDLSKFLVQGFINSIDIDLTFKNSIASKRGTLLLISKRSIKRPGLRYLRRGIDSNSNVANFVETSQFFILEGITESNQTLFAKFRSIRGSIPLFFQQNPANLKPVPYLTKSIHDSNEIFKTHFLNLKQTYGSVSCISLVERSKRENEIGSAYFESCHNNDIEISWFDFHKVCKNMKFDNVSQILGTNLDNSCDIAVKQQLENYGWLDSITGDDQLGIFRINCIDCLDRTNLVQKFISELIFTSILNKHNLEIIQPSSFKTEYNHLWADNGDYISRQYASTNALKGDYTRTAKRNYKGLMTDAWLTMSRYYSGYISDFFNQCFIEFLLGYHDYKIFEDFESTLNVLDPNELNENLNKRNFTLKKTIEDLKIDSEDLIIVGSWNGFQSSLEFNNCNLSYKDVGVILSNKYIYIVKHNDQETDKVVQLKISQVKEIYYGSYFNETHTSLSTNPARNIGLKFVIEDTTQSPDALPVGNNGQSEVPSDIKKFLTVKFPSDMDYSKMKHIINLISKTCSSSTLQNVDIVTLKEAQKKTNVLDVLEYKLKKIVWG